MIHLICVRLCRVFCKGIRSLCRAMGGSEVKVPDAALLPNSGDEKDKPKYERPPRHVLR